MASDDLDQGTTTEAPEDDSIRASITAALAEQEAPAEDPVSEGRARGPDGKFVAKEPAAEVEAPEVEAPAPEKPETPEVKGAEPPANWAEADKAAFKGLPADAQSFLLKRHTAMEADYTRKTQEVAALRRDFEPVAQMLAPHAAEIQRAGYTPVTLIQSWMNVERELLSGRGVGIIKSMADTYRIDKGQIAQALGLTGRDAAAPVPVPEGAAAPIQIPPELIQKMNGFEQFITQTQQERQREQENRAMSTIDQFRAAKDQSGALLHPHFEAVEEHMTRLAVAARARGEALPPLDDLYDQAVWANPSTRAMMVEANRAADEAQRKAADDKRASEARAKAEQARRAGSSVTGAPRPGQANGTAQPRDASSVRDAILAAVEEHEAA